MAESKPDIFKYLDYRAYLRDVFAFERSQNKRLSLRAQAARILPALASSGLLSGVLKGRKNLGHDLRVKFAAGLKMKVRESQFFEILVRFNQTSDMLEKNELFAHLSRFSRSRAKTIHEGQYRLFTRWYYTVVWNYFGINQRQKNPSEIAQAIHPKLTTPQVTEAIDLLLDLGLIKKLANGYCVTENHLKTEPEFKALQAAQYNQQFLELAGQSLFQVEPHRRLFHTMVFSISRSTVGVLREKMIAFQEDIQDTISKDPGSQCIYTFGLQLYPNTN